MGARPSGLCDKYHKSLSVYMLITSPEVEKNANNKCMSNVLVFFFFSFFFFFAWLIMPFNSRSTTLLRRIISQWFWLFSHMCSLLFLFFPSLQNESWIQSPAPGGKRRAGEWADQSWASEADGGCLLLRVALIKLEDNHQFALKKIKRLSTGRHKQSTSACLLICFYVRSCYKSHPVPSTALSEWVAQIQCHS